MSIAGGQETPKINSAAIADIVTFATDGDGWTRADAKTVEAKHGVSSENIQTVTDIVRDYFVSPDEQQTLAAIMSGGDIKNLAGEDGRNLQVKRTANLMTLLTSKDARFTETAEDRKAYVYAIYEMGSVDEKRTALENLLKNGDADTQAIATQILSIINVEGPIRLQAFKLRKFMETGDKYINFVAFNKYIAVSQEFDGQLAGQEAIALRYLILTGDVLAKRAAGEAFATIAPKIDAGLLGREAAELRGLMLIEDEDIEDIKEAAVYAYTAVAPRFEGELAAGEITEIENMIERKEIDAESISGALGILKAKVEQTTSEQPNPGKEQVPAVK